MKLKFIRIFIVIPIIILVFVTLSYASSGSGAFRIPPSDAEAIAKGGAFVGEADNASAVYYNAAGMTQLDGNHISLGIAWGRVGVEHTSPGGNTTQMRQKNLFIPHVYYVTDLNTEKLALGFAVKSNYGSSTDWAEDSFARYVSTKTELENIDYLVNLAYEINDQWSVSVGFNATESNFAQAKNVFQAGSADAEAQLKFEDTIYSQNIAALYKLNERHQFGFQYRTQGDVSYKGTVNAHGLTGTLAAIFGGSDYVTDVELDTALPQSAVIGYSYRPNDRWIINMDAEWTDWSSIAVENVVAPTETIALRVTTIDALADLNLDWKSSWAYSIGAEYALNDQLSLRSGYFFHETPIPNINFNTFLPDADSHGANVGAGYRFNDSMGLDFAWTSIIYEDRELPLTSHDSAVSSIIGVYEEIIHIATLTFNWQFGN